MGWTVVYLGWRTTTLGTGWFLALSLPWLLAEGWSLVQLLLLAFQAGVSPDPGRRLGSGEPSAAVGAEPVDVVITGHRATAEEVERSLIGAGLVEGRGRVVVLDAAYRAEVADGCHRFGARYDVVAAMADDAAAAVEDATGSALYLWLDGGQVPMPEAVTTLATRFADPDLAVCQAAVDLLNADSLAHLRGGRDEEALLRDVTGPGLDRRGLAPWSGPASMIRRQAVASVGGFDRGDPAAVARVLVRLQAAGWATGFERRRVVRATAPDTLDDYLTQHRDRVVERLAVLTADETTGGPRRLDRLVARLAAASPVTSGLRQLVQLGLLVAALLFGRPPAEAPLGLLVLLWSGTTGLGVLARWALARGTMGLGDWTRHGWRTVGADLDALIRLGRGSSPRSERRDGRSEERAEGLATLGRLRLLTGATLVLEAALLARFATVFRPDLLPALGTGERVVLTAVALVVLGQMVNVLRLTVIRRQRRLHHRIECDLPAMLDDVEARAVDLSPHGMGLVVTASTVVDAVVPFTLTLDTIEGRPRPVSGWAVVRHMAPAEDGEVRVGLEFLDVGEPDRVALVTYCAIVHARRPDSAEPRIEAPAGLTVARPPLQQEGLRVLSAAAVVAAVGFLFLGPAADGAFATDAVAVDRLCLSDTAGRPVTGVDVVAGIPGADRLVGTTDDEGCVPTEGTSAEGAVGATELGAVHDGIRVELVPLAIEAGERLVRHPDHLVRVVDPDGLTVDDVAVRYGTDDWTTAPAEAGQGHRVPAGGGVSEVEVTWNETRHLQPIGPNIVVVLARLRLAPGTDATLDWGDGPVSVRDGELVLPGRVVVTLGDGTVRKVDLPGSHELHLPEGRLVPFAVGAGADGTIQPSDGSSTTSWPLSTPTTSSSTSPASSTTSSTSSSTTSSTMAPATSSSSTPPSTSAPSPTTSTTGPSGTTSAPTTTPTSAATTSSTSSPSSTSSSPSSSSSTSTSSLSSSSTGGGGGP